MKKAILFTFGILEIAGLSSAQHPSCCSKSASAEFSALAMNDAFAAAHLAPAPFVLEEKSGSTVSFPCSDGKPGSAYLIRSAKPTKNWLLVIHEWWGLNDHIRKEADQLKTDLGNVNVLAIDLYDGKVAETPALAQQLMSGLEESRAKSIVQGAISFMGKDARIFTMGWCMGGGWSLQSALMAGKQTAGCVMYYGMPEKEVSRLKTLQSDVLFIFAKKDAWINQDVLSEFESKMKASGKKLTVFSYDADHAFANPSNPKFDQKAASEAKKEVLAYLKKKIK